jgi:hypothetical protein
MVNYSMMCVYSNLCCTTLFKSIDFFPFPKNPREISTQIMYKKTGERSLTISFRKREEINRFGKCSIFINNLGGCGSLIEPKRIDPFIHQKPILQSSNIVN